MKELTRSNKEEDKKDKTGNLGKVADVSKFFFLASLFGKLSRVVDFIVGILIAAICILLVWLLDFNEIFTIFIAVAGVITWAIFSFYLMDKIRESILKKTDQKENR